VLVLHGHYLQTRNLEVITSDQDVDIIYLPHHIGHKMQLVDRAFTGALKTFYCQEIEKCLCSNPVGVVTLYQTGKLFGNAHKQAATGEIAPIGFWKRGFILCDKNIFRPHNFPLASEDLSHRLFLYLHAP
jgi:hypothetical protein